MKSTIDEEYIYIQAEYATEILLNLRQYSLAIEESKKTIDQANNMGLFEILAKVMNYLGYIYLTIGKFEAAGPILESALEIVDSTKNYILKGEIISHQAKLQTYLGNFNEAITLLNKNFDLARRNSNEHLQAGYYRDLTFVHVGRGNWKDALDCVQQEYSLVCNLDDRIKQGSCLTNMATMIVQVTNQYKKALPFFRKALKIHRETGQLSAEAITLMNIADILRLNGRLDHARKTAHLALRIFKSINNKRDLGNAYHRLSCLYIKLERFKKAQTYCSLALRLVRETGNKQGEVEVLMDQAAIMLCKNQVKQSKSYYKQALTKAQTIGMNWRSTEIFMEQARIERKTKGNCELALELLKKAETEIGDQYTALLRLLILSERGYCLLAKKQSAKECISQITLLNEQFNFQSGSTGKTIYEELKRAQQAFERGDMHLLFRGEYIPDIPKKYQHWFDDRAREIAEGYEHDYPGGFSPRS